MASSSPLTASGNQPLQEDDLRLGGRRLVDLAGLARRVDLHQLRTDRALVVVLGLGLLVDALGDPDGAADRRQREQEKTADQAHARFPASVTSPVKLYGGSGPTYRSRMRPATSRPSAVTAWLNSSMRVASTRKAALTALSIVDGGSSR